MADFKKKFRVGISDFPQMVIFAQLFDLQQSINPAIQ
jgi:hypothetical protein